MWKKCTARAHPTVQKKGTARTHTAVLEKCTARAYPAVLEKCTARAHPAVLERCTARAPAVRMKGAFRTKNPLFHSKLSCLGVLTNFERFLRVWARRLFGSAPTVPNSLRVQTRKKQ